MQGVESAPERPGSEHHSGQEEWLLDEHDTPAEVDAAFRTQRRVALGYAALFVLVTLAVPVLGLWVDWWSEGKLLGGLSPSFAMTAFGLYVLFFLLALASSMLATSVEDRMLGGPDRQLLDPPDPEETEPGP